MISYIKTNQHKCFEHNLNGDVHLLVDEVYNDPIQGRTGPTAAETEFGWCSQGTVKELQRSL